MEETKIVEDFFNAIEKNDFNTAESLLSKNFKVFGVAPEPLGAKEYLGVHRAFNQGMPDFKFNYNISNVKNNIIETKVALTGTQTKEIPAPIPGLQNIPPTNKKVKMPEETVTITLKDKKIETVTLQNVPNGGLPGVLKQLGVEMPKEALHSH